MKRLTVLPKILAISAITVAPITFSACANNDERYAEMKIIGVDELDVNTHFIYKIECDQLVQVNWFVDDPTKATISPNGELVAKSAGSIVLTAKSLTNPNNLAVKKIKIYDIPVKITVDIPKEINIGQNVSFNAKVFPTTAKQDFVYSVGDNSLISVKKDKICGLKKGQTTIKFSSSQFEDVSFEQEIDILALPPYKISIIGEDKIKAKRTHQYVINTLPKYAEDSVTWTTSDSSVATITSTGLLEAKSEGNVTIFAKSKVNEEVVASKDVQVVPISDLPEPTSVSIDGPTSLILSDKDVQFTAKFSPESCDTSATWSVDAPDIATIDPETGVLHINEANQKGDFNIYIQSNVNPDVKSMIRVGVGDHRINIHGGGFYNDENMSVIQGQNCNIRFVSKVFNGRPVHRELIKYKEFEVAAYDPNKGQRTLLDDTALAFKDNSLIIFSTYTQQDIDIYLLGAEICDWITWSDIESIASLPDKNCTEAYKYFGIGDYKWAWFYDHEDTKRRVKVILLDMYHFTKGVLDPEEREKVTFTFGAAGSLVKGWFGTGGQGNPAGWTHGDIRDHFKASRVSGVSTTECITYTNQSNYLLSDETYFLASPTELNLKNPPYTGDGTPLAYFDENQLIWSKLRYDRINEFYYYPETEGFSPMRASDFDNIYMLEQTEKDEWNKMYASLEMHAPVLFCI